MLFDITPPGPGDVYRRATAFGLVAIFASDVLARHAAKVGPLVTLRHDE